MLHARFIFCCACACLFVRVHAQIIPECTTKYNCSMVHMSYLYTLLLPSGPSLYMVMSQNNYYAVLSFLYIRVVSRILTSQIPTGPLLDLHCCSNSLTMLYCCSGATCSQVMACNLDTSLAHPQLSALGWLLRWLITIRREVPPSSVWPWTAARPSISASYPYYSEGCWTRVCHP